MKSKTPVQGQDWVVSPQKRQEDIRLALLGITLAVPIMSLAALAVRIESGKPILHTEPRRGRFHKHFEIRKIRTLPLGMPPNEVSHGPDDNRAGPVGRVLRKSTLDELPQLFNVLFGDMSWHGFRPVKDVDMQATFEATRDCVTATEHDYWWQTVRHVGRPGLIDDFSLVAHTIEHGSDEYYRKRVELETVYFDEASHAHDKQLRRGAAKAVARRIASVFSIHRPDGGELVLPGADEPTGQ